MSNPYEMFETNKEVEKQGVDINYGEFKITVTRAGGSNNIYTKMLERETKPFRRQIQSGMIDENTLNDILKRVFAKTVVVGWDNVKDKDGKVMQFNYENCMKLFVDLPDLFNDIRDQASNMELFKNDILAGESKNFESSLDTK